MLKTMRGYKYAVLFLFGIILFPSFVNAQNNVNQLVWGDEVTDDETGEVISDDRITIIEGGTYAVHLNVAKGAEIKYASEEFYMPRGALYYIPDIASPNAREFVKSFYTVSALAWGKSGVYELEIYGEPPPFLAIKNKTSFWRLALRLIIGSRAYADSPEDVFLGKIRFTITDKDAVQTCATNCNSNVLFLPGIKGSHLYRPKDGCDINLSACEDRLWEPGLDEGIFASLLRGAGNDDVRDLFLNAQGASTRSDIYVKEKDVLGSVGGKDFYASFIIDMDALKTGGTLADWEPVAYDWRLSLADIVGKGKKTGERISYLEATSTPYIEQELRRLAVSSKTGKVTIVAHSNGGLVAKALLNRLGSETSKSLVDDIIFVGVPQSGAPRAVGSLLYGTGEGLPLESFDFLLSKTVAREFSENSPMAYHLLPSAQYFTDVNDSSHAVGEFTGAGGFAKERVAYGSTLDTASELYDFILAREGGREKPATNDVSEANVLNESLIDYARDTHSTYDAWLPPAEITLYQIAGWGVDTVAGLRFTELPMATAGPFAATHKTMFSPTFVEDGDGVVPIPSALMTSTSSPNVKRYWMDLDAYRKFTSIKRNHKDIFEVPSIEEFIKNIIKNSTSTLPAYISESQPSFITASKKLVFILHSPLTLQLTDSSGNTSGLSDDDTVTQNISGATYGEFGEVKYIIAPEGNYTLNMDGQATGTFTLEMQEMTGNTVTASSTIANVPTTANTLASITISGGINTASALAVDEDGDGVTDIRITPEEGETVNYEPPAPEPEPEPTVSSSGGGSGGGWESIVTVVPIIIPTTTNIIATSTPVIQTVATSTPEVIASTTVVKAKKKPSVPAVAVNNSQEAETPKKVENIPQTASVYDAVSQQFVLKRLGAMVYNGIHSLWLSLMRFF